MWIYVVSIYSVIVLNLHASKNESLCLNFMFDKAPKFDQNRMLIVLEGFPSGQRDQTVNLTATPS